MDKKAIKNFAVSARKKLIDEVATKAKRLGISETGIELAKQIDSNLQEIESSGLRIQGKEIAQRNQLIAELNKRARLSSLKEAFQELVEEVAYTWFNRLIAIRFMEVNDYLSDTYRVLSSETNGKAEPDIITGIYDADIYEEFSTNEQQQVQQWKNDNSAEAMDKLYQLVFIKICNQLNDYLPELFEKVEDYTELLFTASYIKQDGVIVDLLNVPEEDFDIQQGGQVEIIGWLYQYYNSEPHNQVVNIYKGIVKKQDIPAATQLFTTDWVVRYMVDNSLGRYWLDHYPDSELKDKLEYLIPSNSQNMNSTLKPEELKVMDNAMGSGHILVYAFDVLMAIYNTLGYSDREAARAIIEHNLYGLEIDKRAYQLAYFAIMMKGRQYDRLFLKKDIKPKLREFVDLPEFTEEYQKTIIELNGGDTAKWEEYQSLVFKKFGNAKELGSIIKLVDKEGIPLTKEYIQGIREYISKFESFSDMDVLYGLNEIQNDYLHILDLAVMLLDEYTAVVTNPPYLNKMDKNLKKYVNDNYPEVKKDLFSVFIQMNSQMLTKNGYASFMVPFVWMFISSYEKLRSFLIDKKNISSLIQMEYSAFEEATVPICTFTIKNSNEQEGNYIRLSDFTGGMGIQKNKVLEAIQNYDHCEYLYVASQNIFKKIPGTPIAYWASKSIVNAFEKGRAIEEIADIKRGMTTSDNNRFLRFWAEVNYSNISFNSGSFEEAFDSNAVWFPYSKGGGYRKWYGYNEYVIDWQNNGERVINFAKKINKSYTRTIVNMSYYFKPSVGFSYITSGPFSMRWIPKGFIYDSGGPGMFTTEENRLILLGLMNSKPAQKILKILSPTINLQIADIVRMPVIMDDSKINEVIRLTKENINMSKQDWDEYETSWDFSVNPMLVKEHGLIKSAFEEWQEKVTKRFQKIKKNEEELNRIFIDIYSLKNEMDEKVADDLVSIRRGVEPSSIKEVINYAVGCISGRYSLDEEGLIYAGGEWDPSRYKKFQPDRDNVLLITDDEYFKDGEYDIVNRFIEFVEVTFGKDTLEENLQFIADTLGGKGTSREVIRRYFVKDFYKDHLKTYSNRPIYWQLDSGKQNGFKALMYLHRYTPDQLGKVRTDYLHELQKAYDNRIELRQQQISTSDNQKDINAMKKEIEKIQKQLKEIREYDEKLGHLALKRIELDLDDGVIVNYDKLQRDPETGEKFPILAKGVKEPKK